MRNDTEISELYASHVPAAVRLGFLLTGDEAKAHDIAQESFLKASTRLGSMRDLTRFDAYLRRTVVRGVLADRRSESRSRARIEKSVRGSLRGDADSADASAAHLDLVDLLRWLPARQRAAIVLRYWADLPESEIATTLGCAPGTVKSSLARGLDTLRKLVPTDV